MTTQTPRFPGWVYGQGKDPDFRFTLANERTFLAWIRTSLALVAAGVALELFGLDLQEHLRLAASLVLVSTGVALPIVAWINWMAAERALRVHGSLRSAGLTLGLGVVVSFAGLLVLLATVVP